MNQIQLDDAALNVVMEALHVAPLSVTRAMPVINLIQQQLAANAQAQAEAVAARHQPLPTLSEAS